MTNVSPRHHAAGCMSPTGACCRDGNIRKERPTRPLECFNSELSEACAPCMRYNRSRAAGRSDRGPPGVRKGLLESNPTLSARSLPRVDSRPCRPRRLARGDPGDVADPATGTDPATIPVPTPTTPTETPSQAPAPQSSITIRVPPVTETTPAKTTKHAQLDDAAAEHGRHDSRRPHAGGYDLLALGLPQLVEQRKLVRQHVQLERSGRRAPRAPGADAARERAARKAKRQAAAKRAAIQRSKAESPSRGREGPSRQGPGRRSAEGTDRGRPAVHGGGVHPARRTKPVDGTDRERGARRAPDGHDDAPRRPAALRRSRSRTRRRACPRQARCRPRRAARSRRRRPQPRARNARHAPLHVVAREACRATGKGAY